MLHNRFFDKIKDNFVTIDNIDSIRIVDEKDKKLLQNTQENRNSILSDKINNQLNNNTRYEIELPDKNSEINALVDRRYVSAEFPYKASMSLLTDAELKLRNMLDKYVVMQDRVIILEKVRLLDIVNIDKNFCEKGQETKFINKIHAKHVDFMIVDKENHTPICVIELGDFTHKRYDRMESDYIKQEVFKAAGIPMVTLNKPIKDMNISDILPINKITLDFFSPACPICGAKMKIKEQLVGDRVGHLFYSCVNFDSKMACKGNIDAEEIMNKKKVKGR